MIQDMTRDSMAKSLIRFSIPLILSGLLQQLYNWTDAFILGNVEGESALAAVGATISVSEFVIFLITGFSVGLSILTAQMYGNGKKDDIQKIISGFGLLLGMFFLIVGGVCAMCTPQLLSIIQTPVNIIADAETYLRIIFLGMPCIAVYNAYSAVLRGIGDSKIPFYSVIASVVINCVLDIVFVYILHLGVAGAAGATVISQGFMTLFIVLCAGRKHEIMRLRLKFDAGHAEILRRGMALGMPTALQSSITACGNILLQNFMNGFGMHTVAAITTAYRIDSVIMLPIVNLGSAISTVVAQNMGAKKKRRALKGFAIGLFFMSVVTICLALFTKRAGAGLISMFKVEGEAAEIGKLFFDVISKFYIVYGIAVAVKSYLEGIGDVVFSGIISFMSLAARIVLSYMLKDRLGSSVIAYAEGFSWVILCLVCMFRLAHHLFFTKLLREHDSL